MRKSSSKLLPALRTTGETDPAVRQHLSGPLVNHDGRAYTATVWVAAPCGLGPAISRRQVGMDRTRLNRFINQTLQELPLQEVAAVEPSQSVRQALELMREGSRSSVLAMSRGQVAGIFTERDVLTKCMGEGFDWDQPLEAFLTQRPRTISSGATVAEAIATMQKHHYRTLPVVDGEKVVGLIRIGDLLTHLAEAYPEDILNLPPRPHQVMERPEGG